MPDRTEPGSPPNVTLVDATELDLTPRAACVADDDVDRSAVTGTLPPLAGRAPATDTVAIAPDPTLRLPPAPTLAMEAPVPRRRLWPVVATALVVVAMVAVAVWLGAAGYKPAAATQVLSPTTAAEAREHPPASIPPLELPEPSATASSPAVRPRPAKARPPRNDEPIF